MMKTAMTWQEYDKAVAGIIRQYPLIKPNKKDVQLAKRLYKEGRTPQYAANFILLAHR